jgi:hypothetical protein
VRNRQEKEDLLDRFGACALGGLVTVCRIFVRVVDVGVSY